MQERVIENTAIQAKIIRGYTIAVISAALLSTTAIFIRFLTETYHIPALVVAFWRDVFVAITLIPALALVKSHLLKVDRSNLFYLIGYGFVVAVFNAVWTVSVALNGAAVSTVLAYTSAAFTALLGRWFLKEQLGWAKIVAIILCLGGCALVSEAVNPAVWGLNLMGITAGILTGLFYAVYSLLGKAASNRGLNAWTTLVYSFGLASIFLGIFNLLPEGFLPGAAATVGDFLWLGDAWLGWCVLFLLAAVPTVLGFGLYNISLGYLPSSVANLILTLEPFFTAVIAFFVLRERFNLMQLAGGVLILGGVTFLRIYDNRLSRQVAPGPD